jgi:hypothetical protein
MESQRLRQVSSEMVAQSLRQLSYESGVSVPTLKRGLSNEGKKLVLKALSADSDSPTESKGKKDVNEKISDPKTGEIVTTVAGEKKENSEMRKVPLIRVGDIVYAPYEGEYYIAEVVNLLNNGTSARICFLEYDEYSERSLTELIPEQDNAKIDNISNKSDSNNYEQGDFSASMGVGRGGGGNRSDTVYSTKHVRVQQEAMTNSRRKAVKKGPVSNMQKKKK